MRVRGKNSYCGICKKHFKADLTFFLKSSFLAASRQDLDSPKSLSTQLPLDITFTNESYPLALFHGGSESPV